MQTVNLDSDMKTLDDTFDVAINSITASIDKVEGKYLALRREMRKKKTHSAWWITHTQNILDVLNVELTFTRKLLEECYVLNENNQLTSKIRNWCIELVDDIDERALLAKAAVSRDFGQFPRFEERTQLRAFVKTHWKVYSEVKEQDKVPKNWTTTFLDKLETTLKSMRLPRSVFISYEREMKKDLLTIKWKIRKILRENKIYLWYDTTMSEGALWDKVIENNVRDMDVVLLLLNKAYFSKDYILKKEISAFNKKLNKRQIVLLVVKLEDFDFTKDSFIDEALQLYKKNNPEIFSDDDSETKSIISDSTKIIGKVQHIFSSEIFPGTSESYEKLADKIIEAMNKLSDKNEVKRYINKLYPYG